MTERTLGEFRCACIRRFLATAKFTVLATFLTIGLFPATADTNSNQAQIPDKELSAHEQRLFDLLEKKGYEIKPTKVGYDANLKVDDKLTDDEKGEYIWHVSRLYYEQFFYDWKDANGQEHTSNLLDRATDHNQMLALLREVYTNPLIPGFRRDMSWDKLNDGKSGVTNEHDNFKVKNRFDGVSGDPKTDEDGNYVYKDDEKTTLVYVENAETWRKDHVTVPYEKGNYGLFKDDEYWSREIIKPFNGATALLIELNDDFYSGDENGKNIYTEKLFTSYQDAYDSGQEPPNRALEALKYISAIRVIPLQFYVAPNTSPNPGFLFNINVSLSKCFVVTKGVNRPYKAFTHREQVNVKIDTKEKKLTLGAGAKEIFDPFAEDPENEPFEVDAGSVFYNMFEEFSPINRGPMFDAYKDMSTGKIFEVDHNCSSVIGQEHDIIFGPASNHTQIYNVNLMFFLPDNRFLGVTNRQANDNNIYSCYTFYPPGNRPYFFFNRIYADIDDKIMPETVSNTVVTANGDKVTLDNHALVPLHWESLYKTIIQQKEEEAFRIYRMSEGEMKTTPIPGDQIVIRDENGTTYVPKEGDLLDGEIWRKIDQHVKVYVIEDNLMERPGEAVKYVIHGIRAGSDFEAVESNIVVGWLPNLTKGLTMHLTQVGSKYEKRTNHYSNEVQLIHTGYDEQGDGKTNVAAPGNLLYSDILDEDFSRTKMPKFKNVVMELVRYADGGSEPTVVMTCDLPSDKANLSIYNWGDPANFALILDLEFTPNPKNDSGVVTIKGSQVDVVRNTIHAAYNFDVYQESKGTMSFRPLDAQEGVLGLFVDNFIQSIEGYFPTEYKYVLRVVPRASDVQRLLTEENGIIESNPVNVQVPNRTYRVGYQGFTYDEVSEDKDYINGLTTNRPGVAFTVANNPYVAQYEFRCTTHSRALARVERYPGGVFRPFLVESDEVNLRELPRTAESFTGELSMLLDHWVDPGDDMTLVLHFRDSEENAYTNGNSYGFPIKKMPPIPKAKQSGFFAGYSTTNTRDDTSTKLYHCAIQHITDYYQTQPNFRFAGYSVWAKGTDNETNDTMEYFRAFHNADMAYYEHDREMLYNFEFGTRDLKSHSDMSVTVDSPTRMYSEIKNPENVIPAYNPLGTATVPSVQAGSLYTGRYVVSPIDEMTHTIYSRDDVVTGVDGIETEEETVEYFNLQGIRVPEGHLTHGIYIRRTGNKTEKVLIP